MSQGLKSVIMGAAVMAAPVLFAKSLPDADVVILGEIHDNPDHRAFQIQYLTALGPTAVVYEMLTPSEAEALQTVSRDAAAMVTAVDGFHWSNIAAYAQLLADSHVIIGAALPRDAVRAAFSDGAAAVFGAGAQAYGLAENVPEGQLERRKRLQFDAHCAAMPLDMMGGMVEAQRVRDAHFARRVLDAVDQFGAPVVLITGNGHARTDWGVPSYLARVAPDMKVFAVGQSEDGQISGVFDQTVDAPAVDRPDPCAAFR